MINHEILKKRKDVSLTDFEISMELLAPDSQIKRWLAAAIASIIKQMAVVENYISKLNTELAAVDKIIEEIKQNPHLKTTNLPTDIVVRYEQLMAKFESLKNKIQQAMENYFALQLRYIALQQLNLTLDKSQHYQQQQKQQTRKDFWAALQTLAPEIQKTPVLEAVVEKQLQTYVDAKADVATIESKIVSAAIKYAEENNIPIQEQCLDLQQRSHLQKANKYTVHHELKLRSMLSKILHEVYPHKSPQEIKMLVNDFFKNQYTLEEIMSRTNQFLAHYSETDVEIILHRLVVEKGITFFNTAKEELMDVQQKLGTTERLIISILEDLKDIKQQFNGLGVQIFYASSRYSDALISPIQSFEVPTPSPVKSYN